MGIEQLRLDVAAGTIDVDRLVGLIASQEKLIASQQKLIVGHEAEIEGLRKLVEELQQQQQSEKNPTQRLDEAYSEKAEEDRQAKAQGKPKPRKKPKRQGRITTAEKIARAARMETVYPQDCDAADCRFSHTRVAWRLEDGRAILVAYAIHRCGNKFGQPPGLPGRGEFGMEILIAVAYQVYTLGLSLDKACQVLGFFQGLTLTKSQANALLNQLARQWEAEFDTLCLLLANAAVVHSDETSWSINSVWAFLTDTLTLMFYGVHKDGETLQQILDKATFQGVLVSDNAAIYQGFSESQKCWAHLLRKAIKLTLQAPRDKTYRHFADSLLAIYHKAKRIARDQRYNDSGRQRRVNELDDELLALCCGRWFDENQEMVGVEADYRRLVNEIMRLMLAQELFVFVTTAGVDGNNNTSERELRDDAIRRSTGRTNKTANGAKRQTIITSVLRTLSKQLSKFTLQSVIAEAALDHLRSEQLHRSGRSSKPESSPAGCRSAVTADSHHSQRGRTSTGITPGFAPPRARHHQPPPTAADPSPHFMLRTESTATSISTSTRRTFSKRLTKELHGWSTPARRFPAPKFYRTMVRDDTHSPWTESRRLLTLCKLAKQTTFWHVSGERSES